jgi:4-hydroxybenzoate polyprenyltransferase
MSTEPATSVVTLPRGRAARLRLYLAQMFPLHQMVPYAAFHFFALWFTLQALHDLPVVRVTSVWWPGVATITLCLLLMRLYDELKDAKTDIALGRSGDPLYRDRVLVTGAVRLEDVHVLRWLVTLALVALNLWPVRSWAAPAFWILFAVMWLSFNWFFWPAMSKHLLVAFATHNPISLLLDGYVVALFADEFGVSAVGGSAAWLLVGLWLPMAGWETSRKIRAPEDETDYQTYSRALGWKVAGLLPAVFVVLSATLLSVVAVEARLGAPFQLLVVSTAALVVYRCVRFRVAPSAARAQLKPWAMLYATAANVGLVAAVVLSRSVVW